MIRSRFAKTFLLSGLMLILPAAAQATQLLIINQNNNPVEATEHLVSFSPADREVVAQPPAAVTLTFAIPVRADRSYIRVSNAYDMQVNDGSVSINGASMSAPIPALPPGTYRVKWKATCACPDGTELQDIYHFTVR